MTGEKPVAVSKVRDSYHPCNARCVVYGVSIGKKRLIFVSLCCISSGSKFDRTIATPLLTSKLWTVRINHFCYNA